MVTSSSVSHRSHTAAAHRVSGLALTHPCWALCAVCCRLFAAAGSWMGSTGGCHQLLQMAELRSSSSSSSMHVRCDCLSHTVPTSEVVCMLATSRVAAALRSAGVKESSSLRSTAGLEPLCALHGYYERLCCCVQPAWLLCSGVKQRLLARLGFLLAFRGDALSDRTSGTAAIQDLDTFCAHGAGVGTSVKP